MKQRSIGIALVCLALSLRPPSIHAETIGQAPDQAQPVVYVLAQSEDVEYPLPFPGILTTHPLYPFKFVRDTLVNAFISDPFRKLEFSLLQSDKFLSMSMTFAEKNDWEHARNAMELSRTMMEETVVHAVSVTRSGRIIPGSTMDRLEKSTVKHKEIADDLKIQSKEQKEGLFGSASDRFATLAATVSALR